VFLQKEFVMKAYLFVVLALVVSAAALAGCRAEGEIHDASTVVAPR
jgi:hypothetical protein